MKAKTVAMYGEATHAANTPTNNICHVREITKAGRQTRTARTPKAKVYTVNNAITGCAITIDPRRHPDTVA
ncbi:MAG: hypothetical protein LAP61_27195 [Acidobacteriia bacterium]|nr:hypothetical protein [Terriglobia bacterium]